jgi:hypothetical protein
MAWTNLWRSRLAHLDYLTFPTPEDGAEQEIAERPGKDPRDLRVLDPACGSRRIAS